LYLNKEKEATVYQKHKSLLKFEKICIKIDTCPVLLSEIQGAVAFTLSNSKRRL